MFAWLSSIPGWLLSCAMVQGSLSLPLPDLPVYLIILLPGQVSCLDSPCTDCHSTPVRGHLWTHLPDPVRHVLDFLLTNVSTQDMKNSEIWQNSCGLEWVLENLRLYQPSAVSWYFGSSLRKFLAGWDNSMWSNNMWPHPKAPVMKTQVGAAS